jgi:hypothetical protein
VCDEKTSTAASGTYHDRLACPSTAGFAAQRRQREAVRSGRTDWHVDQLAGGVPGSRRTRINQRISQQEGKSAGENLLLIF